MSNYYEELLSEINNKIQEGSEDEAIAMIQEELRMPYVPLETEEKLVTVLDNLIKTKKAEARSEIQLSEEELRSYLKGSELKQLKAVQCLCGMNLRGSLELVEDYLKQNPHPAAAALLIDACIEQEINEELTYIQDGTEITFIPRYREHPWESDGYKEAAAKLREWFENDNPSLLELVMQLVNQESYLQLPLAFEEEEGLMLAASCAKAVYEFMQDEEGWKQLKELQELGDLKLFQLRSQLI